MAYFSETLKGVLYVLASLGILGAVFAYSITHPTAPRDIKTQCAPSLERGHTIVIVDKTDPWNNAQAQRLEDHILWLVGERMKTEERLSIFTFGAVFESGFAPIFSFCKPESAADADDIVKSKRFFQRQFEKEFMLPLKAVLEDVKKPENGPCSPIVAVVLDVLTRREIVEHRGLNRLVLISDLAENSALYSVYRGLQTGQTCFLSRDAAKDHRKDWSAVVSAIRHRRPAMSGNQLDVVVFQIPPPTSAPWLDAMVKTVWKDIFVAFGVGKTDWYPL